MGLSGKGRKGKCGSIQIKNTEITIIRKKREAGKKKTEKLGIYKSSIRHKDNFQYFYVNKHILHWPYLKISNRTLLNRRPVKLGVPYAPEYKENSVECNDGELSFTVDPDEPEPREEEMIYIIKKLENHKAPGSDTATAELLISVGRGLWSKIHTS